MWRNEIHLYRFQVFPCFVEEHPPSSSGRPEPQIPSGGGAGSGGGSGTRSSRQLSAPHDRAPRSSSRPRPRSEEIPMEDIMASGNHPQSSPSMPKVGTLSLLP